MNKSLESKNQRQASLAQQTDSWMTGCAQRSHSAARHALKGASKNVGDDCKDAGGRVKQEARAEAASARQKQAKKRSLRAVNEHFDRTRARACF